MPSRSFTDHLEVLLADAEELNEAHTRLRTGQVGRQWGLGAINRATVVICVSSWEAYVEEITKEAIETLRPAGPALGSWPALKSAALSAIGRFNNPNTENTVQLLSVCLGLPDTTATWGWQNCNRQTARNHLNEALRNRHEIAHGVNPRPVIHNGYASWLPSLFRNLGRCTDSAVRDHLVNGLGVHPAPW
jgi:hypothetical protein